MNKTQWDEAHASLRKVLRKIPDLRAGDTFIDFKFGTVHDPNFGWLVWNGTAKHVIAAVKIDPEQIVMRYRQNSRYAPVLSAFNYMGTKTFHVKSPSMKQHRSYGRQIHSAVEMAIINRMTERRAKRRKAGEPVGIMLTLPAASSWEIAGRHFNDAIRNIKFASPAVVRSVAHNYSRWLQHQTGNGLWHTTLAPDAARYYEEGEATDNYRLTFDYTGAGILHRDNSELQSHQLRDHRGRFISSQQAELNRRVQERMRNQMYAQANPGEYIAASDVTFGDVHNI